MKGLKFFLFGALLLTAGAVIFDYGVGTDDYRHEESQFVFENDWHCSEPGIVFNIYGLFQLKSGGARKTALAP